MANTWTRLALWISIFVGLAAVVGYLYWSAQRSVHQTFLEQNDVDLNRVQSQFDQRIAEARQQVGFLSQLPPIQGIVRAQQNNGIDPLDGTPLQEWQRRLQTIYSEFMVMNSDINQIRYIGFEDGGKELVRVERHQGQVNITPNYQLQAKSDRDYFKEIAELPPRRYYLSEINLNREFGKLENPEWSTMRVALPIFSERLERFGFVIVNYNTDELLHQISQAQTGHNVVLDQHGNFLVHPNEQVEFAFERGEPVQWAPTETTGAWLETFFESEPHLYQTRHLWIDRGAAPYLTIVHLIPQSSFTSAVFRELAAGSAIAIFSILILVLIVVSYQRAFRLQRAMLAQSNQYEAIFDGGMDGVLLIDPSGSIVESNRAAGDIFNRDPAKLVGQKITELITSLPDKQNLTVLMEQVASGQTIESLNGVLARDGGEKFWGRLNFTKIHTIDKGNLIAIFVNDITKEIEAEAVLRDTNEKLEKQVAARTEDLEAALQKAEEATKLKSQFLANMSHEIRTPLNGLAGMLAVLHRTPMSNKARGYLDRAEGSLIILKSIINDILDLSKIEAGKLDVEIVEFNLLNMLDTCCQAYSANASDANTRLIGDFSAIQKPLVKGDPTRVHQILANLLSNALKFTKNGRVTVEASTHTDQSGQDWFTCRIIDNGIGIPKGKLNKVFKAFSQANEDTTRLYGGTGLGLSICASLIELMKGHISVESVEEQGSTFTVVLPLEATNQNSEAKVIEADLSDKQALVLVADQMESKVIESALLQWHCQVSHSNHDNFAERIRKQGRYDFLITDAAGFTEHETSILDNIKNPTSPIFNAHIIVTNPDDGMSRALKKIPNTLTLKDPITSFSLTTTILEAFSDGVEVSSKSVPDHQHIAGKLLVVDDVESNRALISAMLDEDEVEIIEAENGKEALEVLRSEPDVGLVLMDCQMPFMGGLEATERIRQGEAGSHYSDMPIVALTAAAMKGEREACLQAGMNDYMAKPFEMDQLLNLVDTFLSQQGNQSEGR